MALKILGVSGSKRSAAFPDMPTIEEAGVPGYLATTWLIGGTLEINGDHASVVRFNYSISEGRSVLAGHGTLAGIVNQPDEPGADNLSGTDRPGSGQVSPGNSAVDA